MVEPQHQSQIAKFIEEEVSRIEFGKLFVEITVMKGKTTNIQAETKRSMNLNDPAEPGA